MSVSEEARRQGPPDVNPADRETILAPSARHTRIGRFTLRQLSILQWIGTLVAPIIWWSQYLFGYGLGAAVCGSGRGAGVNVWGVNYDVYQLTAVSIAGLLEIVSWICAVVVFLHVKGADWGDGPPEEKRWGTDLPYGRLYFFSAAAVVANILFLTMILLDGTASTLDILCRQS